MDDKVLDMNELLARECDVGSGTRVINCISHMGKSLTERPTDCRLCAADVQNQLSLAIATNKWLNQWRDDAKLLLQNKI